MRCLFLSAYLPSSGVPAAGNKLSAAKLCEISRQYQSVDVVSFRNHLEALSGCEGPSISNVTYREFPISHIARIYATIRYPLDPFGVSVRKFLAGRYVNSLIANGIYDLIFVDFVQAAGMLPRSALGACTVRVHDVMSDLYSKQSSGSFWRRALGRLEFMRASRYEANVYASVSSVSALSDRDAAAVNRLGRRDDCGVEVPTGYYRVSGRSDETVDRAMILFWANYARPENVDAANFFVQDVLPLIKVSVVRTFGSDGGVN